MAAIQIEQLRSSVRGAIVQPGDEAYESARMVYNRMIDKRPALIVRCVDVADVIAAVDHARTNNVLTAIRGGGHNGGGLGTCDGGLVIDLSAMKGVSEDRVRGTDVLAARPERRVLIVLALRACEPRGCARDQAWPEDAPVE